MSPHLPPIASLVMRLTEARARVESLETECDEWREKATRAQHELAALEAWDNALLKVACELHNEREGGTS